MSDPAIVPDVMVLLFVTDTAEPVYVADLLTAFIVMGRAAKMTFVAEDEIAV